jgi:DNA-directed RNA polymerase I, II, and III subunit RPABC5
MIIPVRCYSCGAVIANRYEKYKKLLDEDYTEAEALDSLRLPRYCCRRMILSHIDLVDDLIPYSAPVVGNMQAMGPQVTSTGNTGRGGAGSAGSGSSVGLSSSAATAISSRR